MTCLFLLTLGMLLFKGVYTTDTAIRQSVFTAISAQTGTGFFTTDYSVWPGAIPVILLLATFISGSAGSTSGGMKVIRWLLIWKQGQREVQRLIHPSAEIPVRIGSKPVDWRIIESVWGFFAAYMILFAVLMVLMMIAGADHVTAFSAIASCINNYGVGLGEVSSNFRSISRARQMAVRDRDVARASGNLPAAGHRDAVVLASLTTRRFSERPEPVSSASCASWFLPLARNDSAINVHAAEFAFGALTDMDAALRPMFSACT